MLFINDVKKTVKEVLSILLGPNAKGEKFAKYDLDNLKKEHIFTVLERNISRNKHKGTLRVSRGVNVESFYQVNDSEGHGVEFRYARGRKADKVNSNAYVYDTDTIEISNEGVLRLTNEPELALFMMCHARNKISLRGVGQESVSKSFMTYDGHERNKIIMRAKRAITRAKTFILTNPLPDADLRSIAATIISFGHQTNFIDPKTQPIEEIIVELDRLIEADVQIFENAFMSANHEFRRVSEKAIAEKVLEYTQADTTWKWRKSATETLVVLQLDHTMKKEPMDHLIEFFTDGKRDTKGFYRKIRDMVILEPA